MVVIKSIADIILIEKYFREIKLINNKLNNQQKMVG